MIRIAEPAYPLQKPEFIRALTTGHGRALIHAEHCGTKGIREAILDAALFPKTYDTQCNGFGEDWLARLCEAAGLVDSIISADHGITGNAVLRCSMLKEFALRGHAAAKPALRAMCRFDEEQNELLACYEIVEVEGEEGFIFAVERIGKYLPQSDDYWVYDGLISVLDRITCEGRAMAILEREGPGNPHIAAYREAVLACRAKQPKRQDNTVPPVDELIGRILTPPKRISRLQFLGKGALLGDRERVEALDITKLGPVSLENYLFYFYDTGFPEVREEHLSLLRHPEEQTRCLARSALSHHAEPQVRAAAYEALGRGEVEVFVTLLRNSGLPEDMEPLLEAINPPGIYADDDEIHALILRLVDLLENGKMDDVRLPLWIYEYSPCRICRLHVVEAMVKRSVLPEWVAAECRSDANEAIRQLVAGDPGPGRRL